MKKILLLIIFSMIPAACATTYDINEQCTAYQPGGKIWISPFTTLTVIEVRLREDSIIYHGYLNHFGVATDEVANYRGPLCR
jgi:hypothetical protein